MEHYEAPVNNQHGRVHKGMKKKDHHKKVDASAEKAEKMEHKHTKANEKPHTKPFPKGKKANKAEQSAKSAKPEQQIEPINAQPESNSAGEKDAKKRKKHRQQQNSAGTQTQSAVTPKKAEKKGKKEKHAPLEPLIGAVPIPDLLPRQEERPVEPERHFDSNDILKRKYKRPEKKVIPSLASVSLLPTMELKETFSNRRESLEFRNPLSRSSKKMPTSDATTRMFAEKKQIPEKFRPAELSKPDEETPHKDKHSKRHSDKKQGEQAEEQVTSGKRSEKHTSNAKPNASKKSASAPMTAPATTAKEQKQDYKKDKKQDKKNDKKHGQKKEQRVVFTVAHDNRPETDTHQKGKATPKPSAKSAEPKQRVLRIPARMEKPSRQKDSTEQESLMKPYYLSDRRR